VEATNPELQGNFPSQIAFHSSVKVLA
jgi:hypothetical protein